ncbi:MAG: Capsular polysaccharide export system protein KpsS [uncultured Thiotrichaceae bacterium]|uniref:Capsular polysaccharide export system protein KpsS n=1 Tax=uncultured Thiotrichaceae bacterium TaxID=298394 RepID=A0A6S6SZK0_9GAMM|nr:MAG: Capsular polysaccharide export system protein KpsS [uncultured Thiotrichaceae bacterium]
MTKQTRRTFVFLQGVASPFFRRLSKVVEEAGIPVYQVNFCGGDAIYCRKDIAWDYSDKPENFSIWLEERIMSFKVTDIVLFGDFRPMHVDAIKLANMHNIDAHVFEEGYLRPHWVTMDLGGVNANSSLPKVMHEYFSAKTPVSLPKPVDACYRLRVRATHDIAYHLASFAMRLRFPFYRTHRNRTPAQEYYGWMIRFPTLLFKQARCQQRIQDLVESQQSYYLHPLQLSADTQIQIHSPFKDVHDSVNQILRSFAIHASKTSILVIKNHPLDTGLDGHEKYIQKCAERLGVEDRVIYLETGNINELIEHAQGVIVVNSTVGMASLDKNTPTIALGEAIYNLQGLTYQGRLQDFWEALQRPNRYFYERFKQVVLHRTQINGDLYGRRGIDMAITACLRRFQLSSINVGEQYPPVITTPPAPKKS